MDRSDTTLRSHAGAHAPRQRAEVVEVAELAAAEQAIPASRSVAAALAVLSGSRPQTPRAAPRSAAARAARITARRRPCSARSSRVEIEPPRR